MNGYVLRCRSRKGNGIFFVSIVNEQTVCFMGYRSQEELFNGRDM